MTKNLPSLIRRCWPGLVSLGESLLRDFTQRTTTPKSEVLLSQRISSNSVLIFSFVLTAIPFAFSPEDAIIHLGVAASIAGYVGRSRKGQPNVPFTTFFASILAKYFPTSGFKPLRPTRIQPLYFPTWFVRAELDATVWISSDSDAEVSQVRYRHCFLLVLCLCLDRTKLPQCNLKTCMCF